MLIVAGLIAGLAALLVAFASRTSNSTAPPQQKLSSASRAHARAIPTYGYKLGTPGQLLSFTVRLPLRSGLLFDVQTGTVLWGDQPDRVLPIASLTKMMTALVVVAHSKPSDQVLITPDAIHYSGSGIGLLPLGKRVPELTLLYGLMLPSGNDAAIALADHVSGSRERFITLMNARARQMGLRCTHFNSVSGIIDLDNYSCGRDMAIMTHAVLRNRLLARIVSTRSAVLPFPIKGGKLYLYNNNPLLVLRYPGTDGVKTGYTNAAGHCLVVTVRRGHSWLGLVLLHSADTATQARNLFDAAFAQLGAQA